MRLDGRTQENAAYREAIYLALMELEEALLGCGVNAYGQARQLRVHAAAQDQPPAKRALAWCLVTALLIASDQWLEAIEAAEQTAAAAHSAYVDAVSREAE